MKVTNIHLDAVGGVAGDMFVAAMLHLQPELIKTCEASINLLEVAERVKIKVISFNDSILDGRRFIVIDTETNDHGGHSKWSMIRKQLASSNLPSKVLDISIQIFSLLADAEAKVHGIEVNDVEFHEVGAIDSIVDIVCAATIIAHFSQCDWSIGPIPRGSGLIKSQHGLLPIPAPAAMSLLNGFVLIEDEEVGERVTPTGAAILKYLSPSQSPNSIELRLLGAGVGFGMRKMNSRSNILRAVAYGEPTENKKNLEDEIEVLRCEIDDQTAEDLAVAIEMLRKEEGVLDVCQWPVYGKKGRLAVALQILLKSGYTDKISQIMFDETTTLGVRCLRQKRKLISRKNIEVGASHVKIATRPSGVSAKAEIDDFKDTNGKEKRSKLRKAIEDKAIGD